jgi:hypothetical protein
MAMKIQIQIVTHYSDTVRYQCFRELGCPHLQGALNGTEKWGMETGMKYNRG